MKTLSRQSLKELPNEYVAQPRTYLLTTTKCKRHGKKYRHWFSGTTEVYLSPGDYEVSWHAEPAAAINWYTVIDNRLEYLATADDRFARYHSTKKGKFRMIGKGWAVMTDRPCRLTVRCSTTNLLFQWKADLNLAAKIYAYSKRHSISRCLPSCTSPPNNFDVSGELEYFLGLTTVTTASETVEGRYQCSPFCVKITTGNNLRTKLSYDLTVLCADETATVRVTAIEGNSTTTYIDITDDNGVLSRSHQAPRLTGFFYLPVGCQDVGLHLYTDYGFGGDSNIDKYHGYITYHRFSITYELV